MKFDASLGYMEPSLKTLLSIKYLCLKVSLFTKHLSSRKERLGKIKRFFFPDSGRPPSHGEEKK